MTDFVWPNGVRMSRVVWRPMSNTDVTPAIFTGSQQTTARPGDKLGCTIYVENSTSTERAKLRALVSKLRGKANRLWLTDMSFTGRRRGAFPVSEIFANSDFAAGTTGWTAGSTGVFTASDGVGKLGTTASGGAPSLVQSIALTAYATYVVRASIRDGSGSTGLSAGPALSLSASVQQAGYLTTRGYLLASGTVLDASAHSQFPIVISSSSGYDSRLQILLDFASLSRCFLVDGAGNLIQRSNALATSPWSVATGTGAGNNGTAAPDGTLTAQYIQETDTTNREHYTAQALTVTSSAQDIAVTVSACQAGRTWVLVRLEEATGSTFANAWFNLATGALGSATAGANWSNVRTTITAQGNGWYRCSLVARKTNAATSCSVLLESATADGVGSYAGTASLVAVLLWECTVWTSSVPMRQVSSTSAAVATQTQSSSSLYVKGLPASTTGLLKVGDQVEIDKQIKFVTVDLDSDAGGLGILFLDSPPARALADNTPIILEKPMAKFMLASDNLEYDNTPGDLSQFQIDLVQDLS